MQRKVIMSGFGGQGIMAMGQMLTYAGMLENFHVSWLPSYGPEMRGGSANCSVIISDEPIGAPNISVATDVIVMNQPSLEKFASSVENGGNLFINTTLVKNENKYEDINVYELAATGIANEMGNAKMANMVMLGSFLAATNILKLESILQAFTAVFGSKKAKLIPVNKKALERGMKEVLDKDKKKDQFELEDYKRTPESFSGKETEEVSLSLEYDEEIFEDDKKILEFAISAEEDGREFYNLLAKRFENQDSAGVFKSLAKQEEEHLEYLKKSLEYLNGESNNLEKIQRPNESFEWKGLEGEESLIISSFSDAMKLEAQAIKLYKEGAKKARDQKVKELFEELVYWEDFHYQELKSQYDLYKDGWWADQNFSKM